MNKIICGDCIEEMKKLPDNSVDAIITDPPYGIGFIGKEWDNFKPSTIKEGMEKDKRPKTQIASTRISNIAGTYDNSISGARSYQKFCNTWALEALRILKHGGFMLVSCSTRMYHRMTCGIEDAGFEIRDTIMWLYGSGFPKSLNIGKQIDKMAEKDLEVIEAKKKLGIWLKEKRGNKPQKEIAKYFPSKTGGLTGCVANWELGLNLPTWKIWIKLKELLELDKRFDYLIEGRPKDYIPAEREVIGKKESACFNSEEKDRHTIGASKNVEVDVTIPATPEAKEWEGWGTALKPAVEPIVVARKPLSEKNVALNVLKWGVGGINIDACRVGCDKVLDKSQDRTMIQKANGKEQGWGMKPQGKVQVLDLDKGRFPANIILDEEAGKMLDEQSGNSKSGKYKGEGSKSGGIWNESTGQPAGKEFGDKGGASRFFYCAKASRGERNMGCEQLHEKNSGRWNKGGKWTNDTTPTKNNHPTVKPIKLMEYLVKLVSKEGAVVLDPFLGSGTTAIACLKLNRKFIGIEKEEDYVKITNARIKPFLEQRRL